jgi:hypothetical protein
MFQDSAGTIPVTAVEQPVGRILDKSGRNNHASQSTSGSQPILSARANLLTFSEDFRNTAAAGSSRPWTYANITVSANSSVPDPLGGNTADKLQETNAVNSYHQDYQTQSATGTDFTFSCYVKAEERSNVTLLVRDGAAGANFARVNYDLSTGLPATPAQDGSGFTTMTATMSAVGSWYRCTFRVARATAFAAAAFIEINNGTTRQYTGTTGYGVYVWGADLRISNQTNLPVYQRVAAATDYDTSGFPLYLRFDGTDDSLATGTITPGVNKVQVFAGVTKLSDVSAFGMVAEYSAASSSNAGSFTLMAPWSGGNYGFDTGGTIIRSATTALNSTPTPSTNVISGICDISGDSAALRINSAQVAQTVTDQGTGNFLAYPLYIGRRFLGGAYPFNGRLYSLIVRFSAANLSAAQIASTETWVNGKTRAY